MKTNKKRFRCQNIKPNTKEFKELQKHWYKKLEAKGFKDLEYHEGPLVDSLLKGKSRDHLRLKLGNSMYQFYFLLRNFLTHNPYYMQARAGEINRRFIIEQYTEGKAYREIARMSKALKTPFSSFVAFTTVKEFIDVAIKWNETHPLGYTNCNTDMDFYLEDIMLKDEDSSENEE